MQHGFIADYTRTTAQTQTPEILAHGAPTGIHGYTCCNLYIILRLPLATSAFTEAVS